MTLPSDVGEPARLGAGHVRNDGPDAFALFSFLWAASVLFHTGSYDIWNTSRPEAAAALWVMARPRSTLALAALMSLQVGATLPTTARTPNHALFAAFVSGAFLGAIAVLIIARQRLTIDRTELYRTFGPAARLSLLTLYFFASLHKINSDWFDPATSCAVVFLEHQSDSVPGIVDADLLRYASIYGSLGFEIAIPLLLVFVRTRHIGILIGMVFHWILATNPISGFYNFSSMLFAMYALFAAEGTITRVTETIGRRRLRWLSLFVVLAAGLYVVVGQPFFSEWLPSGRDVSRMIWTVWSLTLVVAWAAVLIRQPVGEWSAAAFRFPRPALAIIPLLVFLNGAAPYLGLHTTATWAMFSNLRTEGGRSNHLFLPAAIQVFDYQRDAVRIIRSSDPELHAMRGRFVPYFEVRRRPEASVTFERRGVRERFARAADDPAFPGPVPTLAGSFMVFRPFDRGRQQTCVH